MLPPQTARFPALTWLLEPDPPGVRYLALRDLLDRPPDDPELLAARQDAYIRGPIGVILDHMEPEGYWCEPGPGYYPKYSSTVWSLILLAQLGASVRDDPRIAVACAYFLRNGITPTGQVSASGTPAGTADCMQGNMCHALLTLGVDAERLAPAFEWMARTVTGEGLAAASDRDAELRYYAGKCGPDFGCGSNNRLPCAWGGVKVMLAFGALPAACRTPLIRSAIQRGLDFFFSIDPATALYPSGWTEKPSSNWWKFGFPVFYVTDLLQIAEALVALGCGGDPRLAATLDFIRSRADPSGRWPLEYDYTGKTWADFGKKKAPNPWVTLRALRVLKQAAIS